MVGAFLLACLLVSPDDLERSTPILGAIQDVDEDGKTIIVKVKGKKVEIQGVGAAPRFVHRPLRLHQVENGASIHVLGRHQPAQSGELPGESLPPQIIQIAAVVLGPFIPPDLTDQQRTAELQWMTGQLIENDPIFRLGEINMQVGRDRSVVAILADSKKETKLTRGTRVRILGESIPAPEAEDPKEKRRLAKMRFYRAEQVEILHKKIPARDYRIVLGR